MGVVTISASYGAGGSEIGPAVGKALGLPFVDRAIPTGVARKLGIRVRDAVDKDERVDTGLWRVISSMAFVPDLAGAGPLAQSTVSDERAFQRRTEEILRNIAAGRGGVVLGRAAAIVLADVPNALHVRLDGPLRARVAGQVRRTGADWKSAEEEARANDSAREAYVRHFYRCDPTEARHYHLVVDSTAFPWDEVTGLIVAAARARGVA